MAFLVFLRPTIFVALVGFVAVEWLFWPLLDFIKKGNTFAPYPDGTMIRHSVTCLKGMTAEQVLHKHILLKQQ